MERQIKLPAKLNKILDEIALRSEITKLEVMQDLLLYRLNTGYLKTGAYPLKGFKETTEDLEECSLLIPEKLNQMLRAAAVELSVSVDELIRRVFLLGLFQKDGKLWRCLNEVEQEYVAGKTWQVLMLQIEREHNRRLFEIGATQHEFSHAKIPTGGAYISKRAQKIRQRQQRGW